MKKKTLRTKTVSVGLSTLLSRVLGLMREALMVRYLGAGADAFITAFKIPNSLRKIFAEGALSAAFIPSIVQQVKKGKREEVNQLMSLAFLLFEGALLVLCAIIFWKAEAVVRIIAPGWFTDGTATVYVTQTVTYLRILIGFILLLSMSALLTGALQAVNHFFIPAFAPVLLNIVFISGLLVCMQFGLTVEYLCYFIMFGGLLQFLAHLGMYLKLGFSFARPVQVTWQAMLPILTKFFPVLVSMSIMEINLFIDTSFASYLPSGSISYLYYANRFMQIPLGVFAVALSTILLPHFARVSLYAPRRLQFYLYEAAKLIAWVTIPLALLLGYFADELFITLFLSKKFTLTHVQETASILILFLSGLFFFSLSKILLNVYYSFHDTTIPMLISIAEVACNFALNYILVMTYGTYGLAAATVFSGVVRTALLALLLHTQYHFTLYGMRFFRFMARLIAQMCIIGGIFVASYHLFLKILHMYLPAYVGILTQTIAFWFWVGPLVGLAALLMNATRKNFGINLYFLE